jgi:GntR family transcriptional regulator
MSSTITPDTLSLTIDTASGVPFYRQVILGVERAVIAGALSPGDKLPTIRALAIALKMNPNTIAKAYAELELRGIVETQVGSGTYVSRKRPLEDERKREEAIAQAVARAVRELVALGLTVSDIPMLFADYKED